MKLHDKQQLKVLSLQLKVLVASALPRFAASFRGISWQGFSYST